MIKLAGPKILAFEVRANYPNLRSLLASIEQRSKNAVGDVRKLAGYSPPVVEYRQEGVPQGDFSQIAVRDIDLPILCQEDFDRASSHLSLLIASRSGDPDARDLINAALEDVFNDLVAKTGNGEIIENKFVIPSSSEETYTQEMISQKGSILLKLSQLGYPVPDFVILTAETYLNHPHDLEGCLEQAIKDLENLTGQQLGHSDDPLVLALRCAMPNYYPGVMPTFLNVGVTENVLPAIKKLFGDNAADRMFLNNLKNLYAALEPEKSGKIISSIRSDMPPSRVTALMEQISDIIRRKNARLLEDAFYQTAFFVRQAYLDFDENQDLLITLSRGAKYYPSVILQKMVCTVRAQQAYAGVLFSRHCKTGTGMQLEIGRNIFGEDIMSGTLVPEETAFDARAGIKETFPAVYHFVPSLENLEKEFQSPVTIEFAAEAAARHQMFALLQLNNTEMTGRAAFISVVDMHQGGIISRKRVTELICPYHIKQIESDTIDPQSWGNLKRFCAGVSVLPRAAVSARIYFSADAALAAKRQGEKVCFCKKTFTPNDTVVMREIDAVISLTPVAIHVVTTCQSFGIPALLSVEKEGAALRSDGRLINREGETLQEGDWMTLSSRRQAVFRGKAGFKPARLLGFMRGEPVELAEDEKKPFADMAYAYRYYQQLVKSLKFDQISTLKEIIRLVNLDLRGEIEEARGLVRGWFDNHESAYMNEVLKSDMGDHLSQHTVFDLLTLDRKIRFFKAAVEKCFQEKTSGYRAGAFMLGRFISLAQPVAFWRAFAPLEAAFLVSEWILFEKYMQVLCGTGEKHVLRARKKILTEGLDEIYLHPGNVTSLMPLKLSGINFDEMLKALPEWCDPQAPKVIKMLKEPYRVFYDFDKEWSVRGLKEICLRENLPVPGPDGA